MSDVGTNVSTVRWCESTACLFLGVLEKCGHRTAGRGHENSKLFASDEREE